MKKQQQQAVDKFGELANEKMQFEEIDSDYEEFEKDNEKMPHLPIDGLLPELEMDIEKYAEL